VIFSLQVKDCESFRDKIATAGFIAIFTGFLLVNLAVACYAF